MAAKQALLLRKEEKAEEITELREQLKHQLQPEPVVEVLKKFKELAVKTEEKIKVVTS